MRADELDDGLREPSAYGLTGRLDVFGEWTEDLDLVTDDEPRMSAFGTAVPYRAQAFGFEIRRSEDKAEVEVNGDILTARFREFFPRLLTDVPENIQRTEDVKDAGGTVKAALVHHIPSSTRPAAPERGRAATPPGGTRRRS